MAKEIKVDTAKKEVQYISLYDEKEIKTMLKIKWDVSERVGY